MAAKTHSDEEGALIAEINVTPLVDITLVLLIIFMVAAPMIMNQAIQVNLPKAATGKAPKSTTIAMTVKKDGSVYLNGKKTDREKLRNYLVQQARRDPKIRAILSADRDVSHGTVVGFLDLLNRCGVTRYAISVEPSKKDQHAEVTKR